MIKRVGLLVFAVLFSLATCGIVHQQDVNDFSINIVHAQTVTHSVTLQVSASTDLKANKYTFYRGTVKGGPYPTVVCTDNPIGAVTAGQLFSCTDNAVQPLATYYYVATATDPANLGKSPKTGNVGESDYSNEVSASIPGTITITPAPGAAPGSALTVQSVK